MTFKISPVRLRRLLIQQTKAAPISEIVRIIVSASCYFRQHQPVARTELRKTILHPRGAGWPFCLCQLN